MCGIAGTTTPDDALLRRFADGLGHRGPDASGVWAEPEGRIGFAHTRLAIIDLSEGGAQPMRSPCGRYALTFNGEIYNYRQLRQDLEAAGEHFSSESDTEVLLRLLMREGAKAVERLVGMFVFAFWDREEARLLLARDRLGIKPLLYARLPGDGIAFASEIAALRAQPGIDLARDPEALSAYLACLYVPSPMTFFRGIRKLPPGSLLEWQGGEITIRPFWRPAFTGGRQPSMDEAVEEVLPLVRQAVVDRMVADVDVGCFLSGGVDSSAIAAFMAAEAERQGAGPIRTFTMTFAEKAYDEREAAAAVAAHIGSRHTELSAGSSLTDQLDPMIRAFGEPFGNPTALLIDDLSRKAREHVTVALIGDGGDEVFAGYPRYDGGLLAQRYRKLPQWLRQGVIRRLAGLIPESTSGLHSLRRAREFLTSASLPDDEMYAAWVEYFTPEERAALLGGDRPGSPVADCFRGAASPDVLDRMQQTDLETFLPGNLLAYGDAMSMRHALELRVPLIDHRLIEAVQTLSPALRMQGGKKALLRAVAKRMLPADIVDRPKRGFNPPMGVWLKGDLRARLEEALTPANLEALGLRPEPVMQLRSEFQNGYRDHSLKLWSLLVLQRWTELNDHMFG
ncbi:asparagine synthase (glutamine-hydrolyzing) [Alphaproteobacteria bacterium HT1-32]|nr:asparagine synthase (glutamine-hydrolyzing) [Alphaproteobacteria bacterium HT1-32]